MLNVEENVNLAPYNTFGVAEHTRWLTRISHDGQITELLNHRLFNTQPRLILGGGSNLLFTRSYQGLVIRVEIKGIEQVHADNEHIWLRVGAGENWHELVMKCVAANYGGVENLALIPGTAGAAPVQNIGAYGAELSEVLHAVEGYNLLTGEKQTLTATECRLGYRDSLFKHELKDKFLISSITLRLTTAHHRIRTSYGVLADMLKGQKITHPRLHDISQAVIRIRLSKLPDPAQLGNAGSFFKNPVIAKKHYEELKEKHPDIPGFDVDNEHIKIPAAWLIEQCGWKGKRNGNAGVHVHQPLVLVNYGGASGMEILKLAMDIRQSVADRFDVELQPEVSII